MSQPLFRLPSAAPSAESMADKRAFDALVSKSLTEAQASAEKWRTGLAGLITLVTATLLFKGPQDVRQLALGGRIVVGGLIGLGLATALFGLWRALGVSAGSMGRVDLADLRQRYGSVEVYNVVVAEDSAAQTRAAKRALAVSLPMLASGAFALWWLPAETTTTAQILVTTDRGSICADGMVVDGQRFLLLANNDAGSHAVQFSDVAAVRAVAEC